MKTELFESAFENAGIGMALVGLDGKFIRVNSAFCKISGRSEEYLLSHRFQDITHPEDLQADLDQLEKMSQGDIEKFSLHKRYISESGSTRPVLLTVSSIVDSDGNIEQYIAQIQDRGEIEELNSKLMRLTNVTELAFEITHIGSWSWDLDKNKLTWDENMFKIFGIDREAASHTYDDFYKNLHPNDVDRVEQTIKKSFETGLFETEFRLLIDGSIKHIYARAKSMYDEYTGSRKMIGINMDMTKEVEARIALEQNKEILDQTQRLTRIGGWKYCCLTQEVTWSETVYDIHELDYSYDVGLSGALNFYPASARQEVQDALKAASSQGKPFDMKLPFVTAKGNRLWVRVMGESIIDQGSVQYIVGCIVDITDEVHTRESLEKANAELSRFAYAASHDLREPLRKISAFGDLLQKSLEGNLNEKQERFFRHMIGGARKMQQQIDDLLLLSKVNTTHLDLETIDLNEIVKESLEDLATMIIEADAFIKVDRLPEITACRPLLKSLVFNLISNALKYRDYERKPEIRIWHAEHEGIPCLFIKDNGIGFDPKYREKIFEPFQRLHTGAKYGGNGIGLATCARVCERHNWKLDAESKANEGATFWFTTESIYG